MREDLIGADLVDDVAGGCEDEEGCRVGVEADPEDVGCGEEVRQAARGRFQPAGLV